MGPEKFFAFNGFVGKSMCWQFQYNLDIFGMEFYNYVLKY